jgi:hypothetical protein
VGFLTHALNNEQIIINNNNEIGPYTTVWDRLFGTFKPFQLLRQPMPRPSVSAIDEGGSTGQAEDVLISGEVVPAPVPVPVPVPVPAAVSVSNNPDRAATSPRDQEYFYY